MGFDDWYRISVHAVITDSAERVLLLKATYAEKEWGLPGGAIDPGETIHDGLRRECIEELGVPVHVRYLSGVYAHTAVRSHAFIFRCDLPEGAAVELSSEHSEFAFLDPAEMPFVQRKRVLDCLHYDGEVRSAVFR